MSARRRLVLALALCLPAQAVPAQQAPDPAAAEAQFRLARRLAVEGSPEAEAALVRVVELDPGGPLADDALVEQALLLGIPRWPEELGRLDAGAAARASALLDVVLDTLPDADRALEARMLRGLLRAEPLTGRDPAAARVDLLRVAALEARSPWGAQARYAVGWLDEHRGNPERARGAYQRIAIDAPESAAAVRALVGLGRLDLREQRFGSAAARLQDAMGRGAPGALGAEALRELAVRALLRRRGTGGNWGAPAVRSGVGIRNLSGMAVLPDGSALLADRRGARVVRVGPAGRSLGQWALDGVQALAVDGLGRAYAATDDKIYRLDEAGPVQVALQASFAPVSAMAADAVGRLWLVDRRGGRIGRIEPGESEPRAVWQGERTRVSLLAWDGRRLLAVDTRDDRLIEISPDGTERFVVTLPVTRPAALAVDPAGHCALLDGRTGEVKLLDGRGEILETWAAPGHGLARPAGIALGPDGSLDLFDGSSLVWARVP